MPAEKDMFDKALLKVLRKAGYKGVTLKNLCERIVECSKRLVDEHRMIHALYIFDLSQKLDEDIFSKLQELYTGQIIRELRVSLPPDRLLEKIPRYGKTEYIAVEWPEIRYLHQLDASEMQECFLVLKNGNSTYMVPTKLIKKLNR